MPSTLASLNPDPVAAEPFLAEGTLWLLQTIEATFDEAERLSAIATLAHSKDRDAGRVLIETFERCMWRETKIAIVRELGPMGLSRTTEFLVNLAGDRQDLALAGEAILALGATGDPLAGEFLLSVIAEREHPLHREAAIALSQLAAFPWENELDALFDRPALEVPTALRQYLILALGRRGPVQGRTWARIRPHLVGTAEETTPPLFNAALIAAGTAGGRDALTTLRGLDTRYRFFAHHLRQLSMERLERRLVPTVEDAIEGLVTARDDLQLDQALQALREFPRQESWEAFRLLGQAVQPSCDLRVRSVLFDAARLDEDVAFLTTHWPTLDWNHAAGLVRLHLHGGASGDDVITRLASRLPPQGLCALLSRVRYERSLESFAALIGDATLPLETRTKAVNGLVAQTKMTQRRSDTARDAAAALLRLLQSVESVDLKARLVRALGQIRHDGDAFLITLGGILKTETVDRGSVYQALARIDVDEAARVILRRLARVQAKQGAGADADSASEVKQAVRALAQLSRLPEGEAVPVVPEALWADLAPALYVLLSKRGQAAYMPLILRGLESADFQTRLLATSAARHASTPQIQAVLFATLKDPNPSLVGRAVDSLCNCADLTGLRQLVAWLQEPEAVPGTAGDPSGPGTALALQVLRSLSPKDDDCGPLLRDLDRAVQLGANLFANADVRQAAVNLRDNLQMRRSRLGGGTRGPRSAQVASHILDADLVAAVDDYQSLSEVMKTVLRNAELTFKHSDLFDDRVDKSTVVVEFVKSIDILLQERLGPVIFLDQQADLVPRMQSRIIQLQLDDDSMPAAQLVRELQCAQHFAEGEFPAHKLSLLCKAILSGKILRDQYSTLDGLRAWGMLLLIFGRRFKFRQTGIEPLLPVADAANQRICELAAAMNSLQELRNQAAHRATLLHSGKLLEIRTFSFKVLNGVRRVLG